MIAWFQSGAALAALFRPEEPERNHLPPVTKVAIIYDIVMITYAKI